MAQQFSFFNDIKCFPIFVQKICQTICAAMRFIVQDIIGAFAAVIAVQMRLHTVILTPWPDTRKIRNASNAVALVSNHSYVYRLSQNLRGLYHTFVFLSMLFYVFI